MKIVLDTNVLIAAFISPKGISHEVFELCIHNHFLFASEFILTELKEKLKQNFFYNDKGIADVIDLISTKFKIVKIKGSKITVCRDEDDNNIIETAVSAKADIIITGDDDLLILKNYKDIEIISLREFYNIEKGIS